MFKSKIQILLFLIPIAICIWMMYPLHGFVFECEYCDGLAIDLTLKFVLIIWVLYILIYTGVVFSNKEKNEKEKKHRLQRYLIMVISIIGIVGGTYSFLIYDGQQRIKHTIDSLKNIVNLHPNNAQAYYNLALELRHQGMWRYAKEVLIKGISIDSTNSDCHLELAYIYKVKNSNINKVISEYRLGLKYMKTDPDWVIREIEWLEELKKRKKN